MNRKGFLAKTLFVLIVSILIFSTSCSLGAKFFRLSSQAKDNFVAFTNEIEDLQQNAKEGDRRNSLLIIDSGTVVAYFSAPQLKVHVDAASKPGQYLYDYDIYLSRPIECEEEGMPGCFCLFREVETKASFSDKRVDVIPLKSICVPQEFLIIYDNSRNSIPGCGVGIPKEVNSYQCDGGFLVDRGVIGEADYVKAFYENGRRINFLIQKDPNNILIYEQ